MSQLSSPPPPQAKLRNVCEGELGGMWLVLIKRIAELAVESHSDGMLFASQSEIWGLSEY